MNVLQVLPYLQAAGTERHALALSEGLLARGIGVRLLAPDGPLREEFIAAGIDHRAFPAFGARFGPSLRGIEAGVKWALERGANLVHVHAGVEALYAVRRALGRPGRGEAPPTSGGRVAVVFTVHSYFGRAPGVDYALAAWLGGRWADRVIAVSQADAARLRRFGLQRPGKLAVVHNGMPDPGPIPPEEVAALRRSFAQEFQIDPAAILCLVVGRLARQKGIDVLIEALAQYQGRPVFVLIAGDGELRAALEEQARRLQVHAGASPPGKAARVAFLGARADVPRLLQAADLFLLPSRMEGLSLALVEAHAAGKAALVTDVGGNGEIVVDGQTGRIVPSENPRALREALAAMAADSEQLAAWGQAARARYEAHFTLERMVVDTLRVYQQALAGGDP